VSVLPNGWSNTTIGEVTESISRGKSPKYTEISSLPIVNQRAIRWFGIQDEHLKYVHPDQFEEWTEERYIREGDILWNSTGTGTIGRACLVQRHHLIPPKVVDSHVTIVRPNKAVVYPSFLFAWIRSPEIQHSVENLATGTTNQIELSRETVVNTRVPLAPLNEQRRITHKLDILLARAGVCRERLERVPVILRQFRQAVLAVAMSGKLTEGWRKEAGPRRQNKAARQRQHLTLTSLCEHDRVITYGVIKLGKEVPDGVPCLRTSNVRWLRIETEGIKRIDSTLSSKYSRTILHGGEVLVNVRGTLGGVAVATDEMVGWNVSREVAVVPVDQHRVDSTFLAYWIGTESSQSWLGRAEKGVAYTGINIEDLRTLPVELPPLAEQREIVRRVQSLFASVDALDARHRAGLTYVQHIIPALLAKAFRGELVPQDPNDESASSLMARLRAEHSALGETTSPRRDTRTRTARSKRKAEAMILSRNQVKDSHLVTILRERGPLTAEALWSASQLGIDDFYDQLKGEEARGLLKETHGKAPDSLRLLEAAV
jgi:type I restriction enzyme S subunit